MAFYKEIEAKLNNEINNYEVCIILYNKYNFFSKSH